MATLVFETIPRVDLARSQLNVALALFTSGDEYPTVITLAGAAEEIFGKLLEKNGKTPALKKTIDRLCDMHRAAFNEEPSPKAYADLRNHARNGLKHLGDGSDLTTDLQHEAAEMLERALDNFYEFTGAHHPLLPKFMSKRRSIWNSRPMVD